MKASNTQTQMRKGILEFCILHMISRGEGYATDMIDELKNHRLFIVEGALYPLLNRLHKAGLATYKRVESGSGPPRKYYSITERGKDFLKELVITWQDLNHAVNMITLKGKNSWR